MVRVESRKAVVTRRAVEQDHVTQHSLTCQHLTQEFLTECSMNLNCSDRYVVCAARCDDLGKFYEIFPLEMRIAQSTSSIKGPLHGSRDSFVRKVRTLMCCGTWKIQ